MKTVRESDYRTSLTGRYLMAATMQARLAGEIEVKSAEAITDAALECEIWEVMKYRSEGKINVKKIYEEKRKQNHGGPWLYQMALQALGKPPLSETAQYWKDACTVVGLRNRLVHHQSLWGEQLETKEFLRTLESNNLPKPYFIDDCADFFPDKCLSASRALWARLSCIALIDTFYENVGFPGRLDPYRDRFI